MAKELKAIVSFTLPSYHAIINEELENFDDPFYAVLALGRDNTLLYCRKTSLAELNDLMLQELYLLSKLFIPAEGERDLDENLLIISQLNSLVSNSPEEKVKWDAIRRYVTETYAVEEIINNIYREWFVVNKNSVFVKLYELSNDFKEFALFYLDLFYSADIIIPFSSFINCDKPPIDLSFYLSQFTPFKAYSNYWLFYFPFRFSKYIKCQLTPISEIWRGDIVEMLRKHHRAGNVTIQVYGYEGIGKSKILSAIAREYRKRANIAPFIQDNWFDIIIHESFYDEFRRAVKGDMTKREERIDEMAKFLGVKEVREASIAEHIIPYRVVNIKSKRMVELSEWFIFGRQMRPILGVYYCSPTRIRKASVKFFINPLHEKTRPIVLDTSMLHSDVWTDAYFPMFSEYFIRDREVIIPSLAFHELFTSSKWKDKPPIIVRELRETLFCKDIRVEESGQVSALTLISAFQAGRRRLRKYLEERSRAIRDMDILLLALAHDGVLVTADRELHKFAFAIGIPSVRYVRRQFLEKIVKNAQISEKSKDKILKELDELILGLY